MKTTTNSYYATLEEEYLIDRSILQEIEEANRECQPIFAGISATTELNQLKILRAFQSNQVTDFHLHGSTGYGYEMWPRHVGTGLRNGL